MALFLITKGKIKFVDKGKIVKKPTAEHAALYKHVAAFKKDVLDKDVLDKKKDKK